MRVRIFTVVGLLLAAVGTGVLAWAVPELISTGSCSTTGQLSGGNREVARCTDEQVATIITVVVGLAVFGLGFLCTFRFLRGRDALVTRLTCGGVAASLVGVLAQLKLREDEVIASMSPQDLDGYRIGTLPLVIGGPVCLLVAAIVLLVRLRRSRTS